MNGQHRLWILEYDVADALAGHIACSRYIRAALACIALALLVGLRRIRVTG